MIVNTDSTIARLTIGRLNILLGVLVTINPFLHADPALCLGTTLRSSKLKVWKPYLFHRGARLNRFQ